METIKIGKQEWMVNNLDVDQYRNGDSITRIESNIQWFKLNIGAWCYYENNYEYGKIYGRMYNWYAVNDPRGLAPEGWHVPSDEDWKICEKYLGISQSDVDKDGWRGEPIVGAKFKESSRNLWVISSNIANNASGFSALPGGQRYFKGDFGMLGTRADFWSSTEYNNQEAWIRELVRLDSGIARYNYDKRYGFSVRCLRD